MELIRPIIKVGNSAGVILPRELYGGKAKITIIETPLNIEKDVFEIISPYLREVLGIYLVGSYARNEQRIDSDIDVLVVTSNLNKKIINGKYNLIIISEKKLDETLSKNPLPIYPMIQEAKPILNNNLLEKLKKIKLDKNALKWHLETTKSSLLLTKKILELNKNEEEIGGNVAYPLILRLRELCIVSSILKNRAYTNKDFLSLLKEHSKNSKEVYQAYLKEKENKKSEKVKIEDLLVLHKFAETMLKTQENEIKKQN